MLDSEPPVTGGVQAKSHDGIDRIQTSSRRLEVWILKFPPTNNFRFSPLSLGKALCPQPWNWTLSYTGCGQSGTLPGRLYLGNQALPLTDRVTHHSTSSSLSALLRRKGTLIGGGEA